MTIRRTRKPKSRPTEQKVENYTHQDKKRVNNPPVGLVNHRNDQEEEKKQYAHDPHLDPQLSWAKKTEHTSFEVDTVSLHVHERIDPKTIIKAVQRRTNENREQQFSLFSTEQLPLREAIQFYKHEHSWSNRLIAGDSLLVMNSLIEKEGMANQVQMVYIDPPYGIKYGSNFQPFVNQREVKDGKDEDLSQEPEVIRAFRDTWELGIHSYLTYLRDRLLLSYELLNDSGSCFVQIGQENIHHIRELMDEVFGKENFVSQIYFATTSGYAGSALLGRLGDYLVWYAKDRSKVKYHPLFLNKPGLEKGDNMYKYIELADGSRRSMSRDEREGRVPLPEHARILRYDNLQSQGAASKDTPFEFNGEIFHPRQGNHWSTHYPEGMERLKWARRIDKVGNVLCYVRYVVDMPATKLMNSWMDTAGFVSDKKYVVETNTKVIQRCMMMTTDPGDLMFDPTCGSGTTAYVAEQWGRRWITCDTSRVAIALTRQRLMTSAFDYYKIANEDEGISSGFIYKTIPYITLKSIANNSAIKEGMSHQEIDEAIQKSAAQEILYDRPEVDNTLIRITGPFTVEAVPSPIVFPIEKITEAGLPPIELARPPSAGVSVTRSGQTQRHEDWCSELFHTGIRSKNDQRLMFARIDFLSGTRYLHATGQIDEDECRRVAIAFGPEHAPLEPRQVSLALEEASLLNPWPHLVVFAAFQFDPEASKDIDETKWIGVTILKVQMNSDLLTEDLKKGRSSNDSFWLIGQPDVTLIEIEDGEDIGKYRICVQGFDYYNFKTQKVESGGPHKIAMWMLDLNYDGRSLFPEQVFFPMRNETGGENDSWLRLAKTLNGLLDEELIESYRGLVSLPFTGGDYNRVAVKLIDDRGIESLKIIPLPISD